MNRVIRMAGIVFCLTAIGGIAEAAVGGIGFVTGIGTLNPVLAGGGGVVGLNGLDNAQAGMRQAISGRPVQTATSKAVKSVTGSHLAGAGTNLAIGLVGPGAVAKMATGSGLFASLKSVGSGAWNGLKNTGSSIKNWWNGSTKVTPNGCFLPGTHVSRFTPDNIEQKEFVPIEQIKEHDKVWSCDSLSGRWQPKEVLEVLTHLYTGDIITVQYEGGQIEVTGGHPIWVKTGYNLENRPRCEHIYADEHEMQPHGRWVNARDLKTGDELISHSHSLLYVLGISVRSELTTVHNLTITDYHTYAVGNAEALVHNKAQFLGFTDPADAIGDIWGIAKIVDKGKTSNLEYIKMGFTEVHYIKDSNGIKHTVPYNPTTRRYWISHESSGW